MTIKDFINPLLKWWWLLVIATAVAGISSYYATKPLPPVYQARSTLIVGGAISDLNPDGNQVRISIQLAEAYATMAARDEIRNKTMAALGLTRLPEYSVRALPNLQMIDIAVIDTNPQRAQAVANELANQLVLISPTSSQQQDEVRRAFVESQLDALQGEIQTTNESLLLKQEELLDASSAVQISDIQNEINGLQIKLNSLQSTYGTYLSNTQRGAINTLSIIEPASLPSWPIGPNKPVIILLVSAIGFVLAGSAAHLLEYLDKTLKTPDDVSRVLSLPVIGFIGEMERKKSEVDYVAHQPRSPIAESFRTLRTNIEFASVDKPVRTILITSADTEDGKTTVATNLGIIMAQGDKKVVILDADLRRPNIHKSLSINGQPGLTDVFRDKVNVFDAMRNWKDRKVSVVTAGTPPPNPSELLSSRRMDQVLSSLQEVADIVVIDGPPILVSDAVILASKVDAVLLVIRPGQTREDVAKALLQQMKRAGANMIGVVLNRVPRSGAEGYYAGYPLYSSYFDDHNSGGPSSGISEPRQAPANQPRPLEPVVPTRPADRKQ
jgi:polysaccharide biosynthesis transport protein